MGTGIKHKSPTDEVDDPAHDVSKIAWNEEHEIDGDVDFANFQAKKLRAENVGSLPSPTVGMIGRVVYLTTDKHYYICKET